MLFRKIKDFTLARRFHNQFETEYRNWFQVSKWQFSMQAQMFQWRESVLVRSPEEEKKPRSLGELFELDMALSFMEKNSKEIDNDTRVNKLTQQQRIIPFIHIRRQSRHQHMRLQHWIIRVIRSKS